MEYRHHFLINWANYWVGHPPGDSGLELHPKKQKELGRRYSVLPDLPYYHPIEMLLIDGMHNLYFRYC